MRRLPRIEETVADSLSLYSAVLKSLFGIELQFHADQTAVFSGENFSKQGCFYFNILYLFIFFERKDKKRRKSCRVLSARLSI